MDDSFEVYMTYFESDRWCLLISGLTLVNVDKPSNSQAPAYGRWDLGALSQIYLAVDSLKSIFVVVVAVLSAGGKKEFFLELSQCNCSENIFYEHKHL